MTSPDSNFALWGYGIASVCYAGLAGQMLARRAASNAASLTWSTLLGAVTATGAMALAGLACVVWPSVAVYTSYRVFDVIHYAFWYAVLLSLVTRVTTVASAPTTTHGILFFACAAFSVGGLLGVVADIAPNPSLPTGRAVQFAFLGLAILGLLLIEQLFRNASPDSTWNVKPLGIGLGAVWLFDLYMHSTTLLFNRVDEIAFGVRGLAYALVVPLLALSIARARERKLKVTLSKDVVFHTSTLVLAGTYLLAVSTAGYYVKYFGGTWGGALQLTLVFVALVFLLLLAFSGTVRAKLRVLIGKHFFRYRYDYRDEWQKFTNALTATNSTSPLGQRVIRGLADMVESPAGALWMRNAKVKGAHYSLHARWNTPETDATEPLDSAFASFVANSGWVINLEEFRLMPLRYQGLEIPQWLQDIPNAWLIVPLTSGDEMLGFVVLTTARTPIDIDWEVNDLLKVAGSQSASFLAQMEATEALLEARKFDAFNRMSAFVVHDLKNIVTQLALMLKNAEKHRDNQEFQQDMLMTVQNSTDRMKQLLLQLRDGTTPLKGSGVVLTEVLQRVYNAKRIQFPQFTIEIKDQLIARGAEERIERVVGHLVQNAIDATPADGHISLTLRRDGSTAAIDVVDSGAGMAPEFVRDQLFKPFQTTKSTGMGIGAHESLHYVNELGGNIVVESAPGRGSRFTMTLPIIDAQSSSGLPAGVI